MKRAPSLAIVGSLILFVAPVMAYAQKAAEDTFGRGTMKKQTPGRYPVTYRTTDNRVAVIGANMATNGGWSFKNPHMSRCWIADGFAFKGYDGLYIASAASTVKCKPEEQRVHDLALQNLVNELTRSLGAKGLFGNVVTNEAEIKPGSRTLRLDNTITEFAKGKSSSRFWAGEFGAGQPVLRVWSVMKDGDRVVFTGESRRTGVSTKARMMGSTMKDEDIQLEDIRSMVLDIADFVSAIAGQYEAKK